MSFQYYLNHLQDAINNPQRGQRDTVTVNKRALEELLRDHHNLDQEARRRHREDFPEAYPPTGRQS